MTIGATHGRLAKLEFVRTVARKRLKVDEYVTAAQLAQLGGVTRNVARRVLEDLVEASEAQRLPGGGRGHENHVRYARPA